MKIPDTKKRKFICCAAVLLGTAVLAIAVPLLARGTLHEDKSATPSMMVQSECTFSDGSTISFGRKVSGIPDPGGGVWRAGDYEATEFAVSGNMLLDTDIPAGRYTLFVMHRAEPWVLIVSKKTGEWGMPYPGERYDLERTQLGSGAQSSPVENFTIGCMQHQSAPIFLWMQSQSSGSYAHYAKIMAKRVIDGKTTMFWH